jgi:spore coat protein U-like protein
VNAIGVNFGTYDSFNALDSEITGSLTITCDSTIPFNISLSAGLGSYSARTMVGLSNSFIYNLYLDPERITIWGDGSDGTGMLSDNSTGGTYPVYGRIPARQNVFMGSYADTIIVTLIY